MQKVGQGGGFWHNGCTQKEWVVNVSCLGDQYHERGVAARMLVGVDGHPSMGLLFLIKHTPVTLNKPAAKNEEGTHYGPKEGPCVGTTSQVGLYKAAVSTGDGLSCACHRQCTASFDQVRCSTAPRCLGRRQPTLQWQCKVYWRRACSWSLLARRLSQAACPWCVVCVQHRTPLPSIVPLIACTPALPWLYIYTKQPMGLLACWPMRP